MILIRAIKKYFFSLGLIGMLLILIASCKKNSVKVIKNDVVITWLNPVDIIGVTALSNVQLNARASVQGTFVYTPAIGTILNFGQTKI